MYGGRIASTKHGRKNTSVLPSTGSSFCQSGGIPRSSGWRMTMALTRGGVNLGIKNHIPVMVPGGKDELIQAQMHLSDAFVNQVRQIGKMLWNAGLPVLDDLHNTSYEWKIPADIAENDQKLQAYKTAKYIDALKSLKPGITMIIMHCTDPSPVFKYITGSGPVRKGDLLTMINPVFKKALQDQGIILTTWRELKERRDRIH